MELANVAAATGDFARATYDAIIVGAGAAGGLAALLLAEANLRVLLLDAGWRAHPARHPYRRVLEATVPRLASLRSSPYLPASVASFGQKALKAAGRIRQPVQTKSFAWFLAPGGFVDDRDFPYSVAPGTRFDWFRTHRVGGRMTIPGHGRQYHRLGADVFAANDPQRRWPISAADLDPWYTFVEQRLGIAGRSDDGERNEAETETMRTLSAMWPGARVSLGRSAAPLSSAENAVSTGRATLRQGAVVRNVDVNASGRVTGVTWVDRETRAVSSARAPIVFLCASALETARILMSSRSSKSPEGLGAASGVLGRCLMDHIAISGEGEGDVLPGGPIEETPGRCTFVPRTTSAGTPYGLQFYRWSKGERSKFAAVAFAEMGPRLENRVMLDTSIKDACGNPTLRIECRHNADDCAAAAEQSQAIREAADAFGVKLSRLDLKPPPPGTAMHECGVARMGDSPANSVIDPNNECWDAKGLYVTDGAAFPSAGAEHPTLTIKALTARACAHAAQRTAHDMSVAEPVS